MTLEEIENLEALETGESPDGQIPCAYCGQMFKPSKKHRKYHSDACKKKAEKARDRTGGKTSGKGTSKKRSSAAKLGRSLWLVRKEAEVIGYILQYFIARRTGLTLKPPTAERREHLAHVIKKLETQAPFSYIQQALYRVFPVFDPEVKPGRSLFGDAAQYAWGWYEVNPELQGVFGDMIPPMFRPDGAAQAAAEAADGMPEGAVYSQPISYEEYMKANGAPVVPEPMIQEAEKHE